MGDRFEHEWPPAPAWGDCIHGCGAELGQPGDEQECPVRLRARVAELEARPTVHPLAWRVLEAEYADYADAGARNATHRYEDMLPIRGSWNDAGCPLTATGGEVLAPGEEQ